MKENIDLNNLENKVIILLKEYKNPLVQVLRYWDEGWFVPSEIEKSVKYIIKNYESIPDNAIHHHESMEFSIERENKKIFFIYTSEQEEPHIVQIRKNKTPIKRYGAKRSITYK
jgi:hypothetical protein